MSGLSTGTKIAYIVIGIISCIAGIWLFMYPGVEEQVLGMVMGWLMIFYGIMAICSYFAADALKPVLKFNIWIGILLIVFGIVLLSNIHATMNFLGILVGIFLIFDAALSFWLAFELKNTGMKGWGWILFFAICTAVLALFFFFNPGESGYLLTILIGAMFISEGAVDVSIGLFAM